MRVSPEPRKGPTRMGVVALSLALCSASVVASPGGAPPLGAPWQVTQPPSHEPAAYVDIGPTTLAQLSAFALGHDPSTRAAWEAALADDASVGAARALLWPTVTGDIPLAADRSVGGAASAAQPSDPATTAGWTRTASAGVSLNWVVFDFGARADGVRAARWQAVATALTYNRELQSVINNVEKSWFTELAALELVHATEASVTAAQASLDSAEALRGAGMATIGDASQARAALAAATLQKVQADAAERSDAGALAIAAGLPVGTPLRLVDASLDAQSSTPVSLPTVNDLLAEARFSRGDLRALDAQVLQAQAQSEAIRAQGLPSLTLGAGSRRAWSSTTSPVTSQQVALTLNVPIFDGGLVRAQSAAARAKAQQAVALRDAQDLSVQLDVWQAFQAAESVEAAIAAAHESLASALVAEANARERYRAGMGTFVELLVAQSTVAQARVTEISTRYNARIAYASLGYAVGSGRAFAAHLASFPR